ncbi:MAG: tetratricopeptide repeat protein [Planctomycetes bacterium]|jgi:tetratricopeptide (TPR) repeat protein|nr:tetratricopeptide repeat protein [Planctomycetota bacterium]
MKQHLLVLVIVAAVGASNHSPLRARVAATTNSPPAQPSLAGSTSCRQCHEPFYQLWAPSHHGLAMQPYTSEFAQANLTAPAGPVKIGPHEYAAHIGRDEGWVLERGPAGEKQLRIVHVMGGKNVYYFLTPLERGRLQTLPVAYDVRTKQWFDTAASGVRHFPHGAADSPVHWTDPMYTFNTSCHGCHVSQLSTNYEARTDTYRTAWAEPGINCEACHGPAQEHVRVCQELTASRSKSEASSGASALQTSHFPPPTSFDLKIIRTKPFTAEQINSMCGACHAKMSPVSPSFTPGERYFDRFDLTTLEHPDFYPDGRDLGENYTITTWRLSPCAKTGKLDCMHCHTSSGRYRFQGDEKPNAACLPCHQEKVDNPAAHTHHKDDSTANRCIACHMPMTEFARMTRSDHSMRPPTPAATLQFKSPNACNLCHADKDAAWADQQVRQWHKDDYQKPVLERAALLDGARRGDWRQLGAILAYVGSQDREEIYAASLIRLLHQCGSPAKWPVVIKALQEDPSPLVRAAAAQTLEGYATVGANNHSPLQALAKATADEYLLVRVRAATALAGVPSEQLPEQYRAAVGRATTELLAGLNARPDDYASQYSLGNFYLQGSDQDKALASYESAIKLRPDFVPPYVNVAFVHNAKGQNDKAEASFRRAIALDPNNPVVHLNLAMLLGEMNRPQEAEQAFRKTLQIDPNAVVAAHNLGVMLASDRPYESLRWCQKAYQLVPEEGKYGYTYAFFLHQQRDVNGAIKVLQDLVRRQVPYADAYALLGEIHLERGEADQAAGVYRAAGGNGRLTLQERDAFRTMLRRLEVSPN